MNKHKKEWEQVSYRIEWVHNALQEAINGNTNEAMLKHALELVEDIREVILTVA